jgi:mannose-1-phosphate guanylyltransferase / mannose-6-phosphate isomerase
VHWVVVKGTAEITLVSDARSVHENESIYIPIGSVHRLANPGNPARADRGASRQLSR